MSIKKIRQELGLKQSEFARLFGVHQTAVSQWETGRTSPDTDTLVRIARATGHTVDEILDVHTVNAAVENEEREILMPDNSMRLARILKDDRIYIRKSSGVYTDGALIGVRTENENTVRYLKVVNGEQYLATAENPASIKKCTPEDVLLGLVYAFYSEIGGK